MLYQSPHLVIEQIAREQGAIAVQRVAVSRPETFEERRLVAAARAWRQRVLDAGTGPVAL